jgi:uncharacterized membrane protein
MRHRSSFVRIVRGRLRLWTSAAFGLTVYALLVQLSFGQAASRSLLAWNAGAGLYLLLALHMAWGASPAKMERRAVRQGEGRLLVLALVVVSAVAVLLAVGSQLAAVKELPPGERTPHVLLAALTVLSAWLFTQTLFAVNYAHDFYLSRAIGRADVLSFPGTAEPNYGDFFYFACVIGTSGQTADVAFVGRSLRPVGTLHCVLAFFFNTTVLALTINIAAGLF